MAKLFDNIETGNKNRNKLIKGLVTLAFAVVLIFAAFINDRVKQNDYYEEWTASDMMVHIKGAVVNSGVYTVPFGTRVIDVGDLAGGFTPDANLDGVNLAEYVKDGEEIYIPYKGSAKKDGFDLNKVTYDELVRNIEGIGATYAARIIEYREKQGGFRNVNELKNILKAGVYEKVSEKFYIGE